MDTIDNLPATFKHDYFIELKIDQIQLEVIRKLHLKINEFKDLFESFPESFKSYSESQLSSILFSLTLIDKKWKDWVLEKFHRELGSPEFLKGIEAVPISE